MFTNRQALEAGIPNIAASPRDHGVVEKIVCRPKTGERQELAQAQLDEALGLVGDNWSSRGDNKTANGLPNPQMQLNLMNARAIDLIAQRPERWQLAGDQFFVDLDLSPANLPPGTRLQIGDAIIEVTAEPHLGCAKFKQRFGLDAAVFVNTDLGKSMNLRGINARVMHSGRVEKGAVIRKLKTNER